MDSYNNSNHMSGQPMPPMNDATAGQRPELYSNEAMPQYPSGPYVPQQPLRRPNNAIAINSTNDSMEPSITDIDKRTSNLSLGPADNFPDIVGAGDPPNNWIASEPKEQTHHPMSSLASNLSPFAKEFVPRVTPTPMSYPTAPPMANGLNTGQQWHPMTAMNENREFDDFIALSYLREFIDTITIKPNKYDSGIDYLTEVLNTYIDEDETVMDSVVNIIVDQAIVEPQFRYNGVRLCLCLMQKLVVLSDDKDFRKLLLRRCQREYSRRDNLIRSSSTADYLRGLTLFIGDLYSRQEYEELAQILPQLLLTLLSKPEKENLKCICQVLKLCGSLLEKYFTNRKSDEPNDFSKVMDELAVCVDDPQISPYVKELMTNIIKMQKRNWTANLPSTAAASTPVVNPYLNTNPNENNWNYTNDFIEPYENGSDEDEFAQYASYDFGQCGDEEDNEVCEAFEEFLKNSGQTK